MALNARARARCRRNRTVTVTARRPGWLGSTASLPPRHRGRRRRRRCRRQGTTPGTPPPRHRHPRWRCPYRSSTWSRSGAAQCRCPAPAPFCDSRRPPRLPTPPRRTQWPRTSTGRRGSRRRRRRPGSAARPPPGSRWPATPHSRLKAAAARHRLRQHHDTAPPAEGGNDPLYAAPWRQHGAGGQGYPCPWLPPPPTRQASEARTAPGLQDESTTHNSLSWLSWMSWLCGPYCFRL